MQSIAVIFTLPVREGSSDRRRERLPQNRPRVKHPPGVDLGHIEERLPIRSGEQSHIVNRVALSTRRILKGLRNNLPAILSTP